ncbi:MAG: sulfatase-like hydrolase/transferase, partial [Planctomycetota bacterium]
MPGPNLVFLFTDEQRADTMAAYGNGRIDTPNLNRLAEQGTVFERAYVTQPVCTPSRASIMTGLYPHTCGCTANNVPLPADVPCLPEMLPRGEYVTAYHGKWHLGDEIFAQHGFDEWVSIEDMYRPHYSPGRDRSARSDYHHWLTARGVAPATGDVFGRSHTARLGEELSKPAFLAETASRFIAANRDRPFALYVNFLEPHMPFFGPRDGQYDPDEIDLPANFAHELTDDQSLKGRVVAAFHRRHGHSGLPLADEADWRRMIGNYWGLCSQVDTHVGTILAALDECGLMDNTIVVYTSDHGDMMGSHRLIAKCVQYEEAVRVPLLVRLPGQSRPRRVARPISQIDLIPTLLDAMGCAAPGHLQGASVLAAMEGRQTDGPGDVVIEWNGGNVGAGPFARREDYPDYLDAVADWEAYCADVIDPVRTAVGPDGWKL